MTDSENALAAERSVIGSALLDTRLIRVLSEEVQSEDFYSPMHEAVWRCIVRRWTAQEPISDVLVAQEVSEIALAQTGRQNALHVATLIDMHSVGYPVAAVARLEARAIHDASIKRKVTALGVRAQQIASSGMPMSEVMTLVRGEFDAVSRAASPEIDAVSLGDLLSGEDDYDWLIPGILERGDRIMITGGEGGGKTTMGRQLSVLPAAGLNPITFEKIDPVNVLVIDCENRDRQWRRKVRPLVQQAARLGNRDPSEFMHLALLGHINIADERWLGAIHRLVDRHKPDLMYLGPLYKMSHGALNTDDDAMPVLSALDSIRDRGVALIIEAHAGHSQGDGGKRNLRPRGSSAFLGWPEFGFGLRRDDDNPNETVIERWRGDRDERSWPERVKRGGDFPWTPVGDLQAEVDSQDWTVRSA